MMKVEWLWNETLFQVGKVPIILFFVSIAIIILVAGYLVYKEIKKRVKNDK